MDGLGATATPAQQDPFAALGAQYETTATGPAAPPAGKQDPFAALGAQYEPATAGPATSPAAPIPTQPAPALKAPVPPTAITAQSPAPPPTGPAADAARLQSANQRVRQQLDRAHATMGAAPEQGWGSRVLDFFRNSPLGHAVQTEFPDAPDWMKPTTRQGTEEYQQEQQGPRFETLTQGLTQHEAEQAQNAARWASALPTAGVSLAGPKVAPGSFRATPGDAETPAEQKLTGFAQQASELTSAPSIAQQVGIAAAGELAAPAVVSTLAGRLAAKAIPPELTEKAVHTLVGAGFTAQMAAGAVEQFRAYQKAKAEGDTRTANHILGGLALNGVLTALGGAGTGLGAHAAFKEMRRGGAEAPPAPAAEPVKAAPAVPETEQVPDPFAALGAQYEEPAKTDRVSDAGNSNVVPRGTEEHPPIGETEPETGRPVLQQSPRPEVNQAAATAEHPAVKDQIAEIAKPIDGAELAGSREEKDAERLGEKMENEGQSPRTVRDYSGFRIAVDSPQARDAVVAGLRGRFEIPDESDEFEKGAEETGFHGHTLQVREPGSPVTHEVQVLPREVAEAADGRHGLYEKAREGDKEAAAELKQLNEQDWAKYQERNGQRGDRGAAPEPQAEEPKYKFGSTQANIPADSEAAGALKAARAKIDPADLMPTGFGGNAKGLETEPHITLRYGLKGEDTAGVRRFIQSQAPFEATLGPTDSFPPSEHSDGAAPIIAPVDAPELHRIEAEIGAHGDFAERSFPEYKPHATLGYVKPEAVDKYTGMKETDGKKFLVRSIAISDRNGKIEEIPLRGQSAGMPAEASSAAESSRPWSTESVSGPEGRQDLASESQISRAYLPSEETTRSMSRSSVNEGGISNLGDIDPISHNIIRQPEGDYKAQMQRARQAVPAYEKMLEQIAADHHATVTPVNLKGEASVQAKLAKNPKRPAHTLSDYIRARMRFDTVRDMRAAVEDIRRKFGVMEVEDFVDAPKNGGYRAIHMQVHLPNGMTAELQMAPREIFDVQEAAHHAYEVWRDPRSTPEEQEAARDEIARTFGKAWEAYKNRVGGEGAGGEQSTTGVHQRAPQEDGGAGDGPGRVEPGEQGPAPAGAGNLFGEEQGPRATAAAQVKPNEVARVPVAELKADPKRFQYKMSATSEAGTTDLLKGRKWNDALAGVISVWRDPTDGQVYVVNGHHRYELASSSRVPHMNVLMLDAPDAATARSMGALQNIAEGRGTPLDAAKFFRDSGYTPENLDKLGVSMGEATAANGIALSRLDDRLFDDVVTGKLRQNRAIAIGKATDKPEEQEAILKLIEKAESRGRKVSDDTVDELARMARGAGQHTDTQETLFGAQEMTRNLALEKAEVSSYIREQIGKEKRLFGSVADEGKAGRLAAGGNKINAAKNRAIAESAAHAQELYDRLSTRAGEVDEILNRAAQQLAKGGNPNVVKQGSYEQIRASLSKALREPAGGEPEGIRSGAGGDEEERSAAQRGQGLKAPPPPEAAARPEKWEKGERFLVRDPATGAWKAGEVTYYNEGVNGAKPGGRSKIGSDKVDEIPPDALRVKASTKPIEPIVGTDLEKGIIERTQANLPRYTAEYIEKNTAQGVPTIAADLAKEAYPEFKADPTGNDRATEAGAKAVRDAALKTVLAAPVDRQRPDVLIITASPGSGKTTGLAAGGNPEGIGIKVEAIADHPQTFRDLVQQVLDSGRRPVVNWVYIDDPAKTVYRMFRRAVGHDGKLGIGRTVELGYMAHAYTQVPRVLERLQSEFGDRVKIVAIDNSGPKGSKPTVTDRIQPFVDAVKQQPYNRVLEEMQNETRRLQSEGLFDGERGKAILQAAQARESGAGDQAGRGRAQGAAGVGSGGGQVPPGSELGSPLLSSTEGRSASPVAQTASHKAGGAVSPEEFKAGLDVAKKRSLRENVATQQARVIETPGAGKGVVLDPDGYAVWHRAALGEGTAWRGMSLERASANRMEVMLRSMAGSARAEAGGMEAAAGYDRMVQALREGRNEDGSVTLLRGDYRPDTVLEEAWHRWQRAHRIGDSDAIRAVAQRPEVKEIAARLEDMGYGKQTGIEGRSEVALEMMAKALAGDPDLKITPEERHDLVHSFLSEAVREFGPEVLKDIPGVTPEAEAALADARRTYEAQPDATGRGQAPRGQVRAAGEAGAERGGPGARDTGGPGQSAPGGDEPGAAKAGAPEDQLGRDEGPAYQRTRRGGVRAEDSLALPGMEAADTERKTAHGEAEAKDLTERMRTPLGDISSAAGELERHSPLFFGTGENRTLFDMPKEPEQGALFQRDKDAPLPVESSRSVDYALRNLGYKQTFLNDHEYRWTKEPEGHRIVMDRDQRTLRVIPAVGGAGERAAVMKALDRGGALQRRDAFKAMFQRDSQENPVARSVQDLVDAIAREPRNDERTALERAADFTGRTLDEATGRAAATLRETPSRVEHAWSQARLLTAALVDGWRHPLKATDWKRSVGQMDLARAETALKLRELGRTIKDFAPDPLARIGMTHFIEAGGDMNKLDEWAQQARNRWHMRSGDPNIDPRLKNHLAESVKHYEAARNLTPEQVALATRIKQHFDDLLGLAKANGLLEYGARNYVRHLYESADAADLVRLLDTNELNPNPGFIEQRVFRSYFEAENHGLIPRNKDLGYLVTAYDKSFNQALASRTMLKSLLDGRARDGRPLAAIRQRGKWLLTDEAQRPQVLEQRERPKTLAGYRGFDHAPTRNFLFEPTMEDLEGYQYDPKLFEEDPQRLAFRGDLIFHPEVASRVDDMLTPGWFDRNENMAQKVGHVILQGSALAKEMMTMIAPFHMVQLAEHSVEHWVNPVKLPDIDLSGGSEDSRIQRLLASNGLGLMDFDAEGLFSARTLKGLADGIPGLNVAMDGVNALSRWQFEDVIPRMKMKMARTAFDRNWKSYGEKLTAEQLRQAGAAPGMSQDEARQMAHERAERMIAELTAKQANAAFGNLNTAFDSIHRSKTFKQLLRLTLFAPDFLESRIRYTAQAMTRYGGEQRIALLRGALGMYVIARAANAMLNNGDTKNDLEHAFTIVAGKRNISLRSQEGDILHLVTNPRSFVYNRVNPLTVRPIIEYLSGRDQFGRQMTGAHVLRETAKGTLPMGVQKIIQTPDESWLNSILSSSGVITSNYRSPAEEMTHKLYLRSLPDLPDDPEKQAQSRAHHQLEEDVREGRKKPADVIQLAKQDKMGLREAWNIIDRAGHSKLYNEFASGGVAIVPKHAGDASALDIYAAATPAERMELRPALIAKGENQIPDIRRQAPARREEVRALEKAWEEQAKIDPSFKPPAKTPDAQFEVLAELWRSLLASTPHQDGVPPKPGQQSPAGAVAQK